MAILLRAVRLLAMVVWVGGLVFFAFFEAPIAVQVLGTTRDFAVLIGESVMRLNVAGHISGFVFLIATIAMWFRTDPRGRKLLPAQMLLVLAMIAATMVVEDSILPAMERDRMAAGGDINTLAADSPARVHFDRMHTASEDVEGGVLLLGVGVVVLIAAERGTRRPVQAV